MHGTPATRTTPVDPYRTVQQIAAHFQLSRQTIARLVRDESLPAYPGTVGPGGRARLRFKLAEVEAWMSGRRERQLLDWKRYARTGAA